MNKRKTILSILFSCFSLILFAQDGEKKNFMESNGKIYVVMAVVVVIVIGLLLYLINLDRKISRLERNQNKN